MTGFDPRAKIREILQAKPETLPFLEALSLEDGQALYERLVDLAMRVARGNRA